MEQMEHLILSAFDRPGTHERTLSELAESPQIRDLIDQFVQRGWLRPGTNAGTYLRTEEGRLQLTGPLDLTIYSRPGCHLCEEAKSQIDPLLKEFGARLTEINIDEDPVLRTQYDYDVPVILLGTRKVAKHRVDLKQFRRQLMDAAQSGRRG
jgi:glutaredoxin